MTVLLVVTLVSLVLAVAMSAIAWRVAREERVRAGARVAALASDIQTAVAAAGGTRRVEPVLRAVRPVSADASDLFTASPTAASSRSVVVVGMGLFAFATLAALAVVFTSGLHAPTAERPVAQPRGAAAPAATATPVPASLDLVALGHERDGDRLVVRGVVRNPSTTAAANGLTAVVFAFDRDGGFVTSGRAAVDAPSLTPGGDSTFTVTLSHAERVVRYRVSFRTDAAIVPHVDRRHAG
jgi:hypothetical protein